MTIVKGLDHLKLVYESTLLRIATTLETLASTPNQTAPDVSAQPAKTQILSLQAVIDIIDPMIEMMQETIKEDKQVRDEIKRVAEKFKAEESIASLQWLASYRDTNTMDINFARVQSLYSNFIMIASTVKQQKRRAERTLPAGAGGGPNLTTTTPATTATTTFKLPEINIPIFDGNITKYQPFWDLFESLVDSTTASDVQKLSFLITRLRGEPLNLLKDLPLTSQNYTAAKQLLEQRYKDTDAVQRLIRAKLFSLPVCHNRSEVKTMFLQAESYLRQLEAITTTATGKYISPDILQFLEQRLPYAYLQRVVVKKQSITTWNLAE
ncbi:MAG TPA: DUF1759 domain-containing protein, partial [Puia sp.]|nr:DUF1759 domain-containing protein [Puia sp.]